MEAQIRSLVERLDSVKNALLALGSGERRVYEPGADGAAQGGLAENTYGFLQSPASAGQKSSREAADLELVETMISVRFMRDRFFESDLFFDPSWSMLIDLYRAELTGKDLSVTSVCIGSGVADTTALRYIKLLEERDYIYRVADPMDRRRAFLRLTNAARDRLRSYFGSVGTHVHAA